MCKMRYRSPERIIKLYNWLWDRAVKSKLPPFNQLQPVSLTGRALWQLVPQMVKIGEAMNSRKYRDAVSVIIHSN